VPNRIRMLSLAVPISLCVIGVALVGSSLGSTAAPSGLGSALVGSAPVGRGPSELAVDPATHTIYVENGYNDNGPQEGGDTVSVIDASHCDAQDVSRCKGPWPTITVGKLPAGIAVDQQTDTVYVASVGDNSVSVFNGATCNATDTSGCRQTPAKVPVGLEPLNLFADPANHTVYVANFGAPATGGNPGNSTTVSMINSATCNATDLAACPSTPPPTVKVGGTPSTVTVDPDNDTVYVTTIGKGVENGWSVFDANTCNATVQSGCGAIGRLAGDPAGPSDGEVDTANDTLYSANYDNTISAYDLSRCNAADLAGCANDKPGTVTPWPNPGFGEHALYAAVDQPLHSVYVSYEMDAALVVVNTNVCNGTHLAACARRKPDSIHTGAEPEGLVLDPTTQTLYTANEVDNDISVISAAKCSAQDTAGCRHPVPSVTIPNPGAVATDNAVHTAYITSGTDQLAMIDTRRCNARQQDGCARTSHLTVGMYPSDVAIDPRTNTVYVADSGARATGSVAVLNATGCNATVTTRCARVHMLHVLDGNPTEVAVDPSTNTIYVATNVKRGPNLVDVFNGATCNASDTDGCGQAPALLRVGHTGGAGIDLAINDLTNTLYVTTNLYADPTGDAVYVFNTARCDAQNTSGCRQTPASDTVGDNPQGLAVDESSDTIYAAVHREGDYAASVAIINGATCNGKNHSGCDQKSALAPAGFGAIDIAIDPTTQLVYTTNLHDTSVSVINGATCNGTNRAGCRAPQTEDAVGNYPSAIAVDPGAGTAYVVNQTNVSLVPLRP
jgi:DNA-binding beta-propeller fold protein YncE